MCSLALHTLQDLVNNGTAYTYDNNGNLTDDGTRTYTWNARNQLTGISGADTASFTYDAFGRRRSATLGGQTVNTLYDGWNAIQLQTGSTAIENRLTGLGLDSVFARTRGGITESYLTDALGSTLELRNAAQTATVQYSYDPYGGTQSSVASSNTVKYTGRDQDLADLYYYRNRYYKPSVGRFISEDPIGLAGGSNVYAYVVGNPVDWVDPLGLLPCLNCHGDGFMDWWNPDPYLSNPLSGDPGSESSCDNTKGNLKQTRRYGPDGYPETDTDWDHSHGGLGKPHAHDWGRPSDGGKPNNHNRGPGRPTQPGDPGIP